MPGDAWIIVDLSDRFPREIQDVQFQRWPHRIPPNQRRRKIRSKQSPFSRRELQSFEFIVAEHKNSFTIAIPARGISRSPRADRRRVLSHSLSHFEEFEQ